MKIIKKTVYTFDELDDHAKEKARDWYRSGDMGYDWWENVYEDAREIGIEIKEFDIDRGSYVKAKFLASAEETAHKIEKNHGDTCPTHRDAITYLEERNNLVDSAEKDDNGDLVDEYKLDNELDDLDSEFLKTLQEDYRIILQSEYEYLMSNEHIDDTILANEYTFTETGKREG